MVHQLENLISFKMVYYKPYLVSILDLDDFFIDLKIAIFYSELKEWNGRVG